MLKLGRAQGVVIAAALEYGIDVYEYAPRRVKILLLAMVEPQKNK